MNGVNEIQPLKLVKPDFDDGLTDILLELNHLRKLQLMGSTQPQLFFQIRAIFHLLESVGSARIEGNHTTVPEYLEQKIDRAENPTESFSEIQNVEKALSYIEDALVDGGKVTHRFIKELHQMVVEGLDREGDNNAGGYREKNVRISQSKHIPPSHFHVEGAMNELLDFINREDAEKYEMLKIALVHHRFTWIHPFGNGNGRVVRLLTYALLIKYGFKVKEGQLINPTAVFCKNRELYYDMLAVADQGDEASLLEWCEYVLAGFLDEVTKVNQLLDFNYLRSQILLPTIAYGKDRGLLNDDEVKILNTGLTLQSFTSRDLDPLFKGLSARQKAHRISKLKDAGFLTAMPENPRTYYINFSNGALMRGMVHQLQEKGIIDFDY